MTRVNRLRFFRCGGLAVIVLLARHASAQPPPWPSIPAQLNLPTDASELTTDRIQSTLLEVRLAQTEKATNVAEATQFTDAFLRDSGRRLHLHRTPLVTNNHVVQARVVENRATFEVEVTSSPQAAARMQTATSLHHRKPLAIIVNGELVAAPLVRDAVSTHLLIS